MNNLGSDTMPWRPVTKSMNRSDRLFHSLPGQSTAEREAAALARSVHQNGVASVAGSRTRNHLKGSGSGGGNMTWSGLIWRSLRIDLRPSCLKVGMTRQRSSISGLNGDGSLPVDVGIKSRRRSGSPEKRLKRTRFCGQHSIGLEERTRSNG